MPSNDHAKQSGDRLDRFLIDEPKAEPPRRFEGIDAFLATPPLPAEPAPPAPVATPQAVAVAHEMQAPAEAATIDPHSFPDEALKAAGLPILEGFPPETVAPPALTEAFEDSDASLIAPPSFDFAGDAAPEADASLASDFAVGVERGRGDDVLSALAANPLDDRMLADPSALLSAAPLSNPSVAARPSTDRFDPWSSDASPLQSIGSLSRFGPPSVESRPSALSAGDAWSRVDDRSSSDSDAFDRLEGRLSRAVAQLEEAVSAISASGPAPLGSRPRGFKGRIDA